MKTEQPLTPIQELIERALACGLSLGKLTDRMEGRVSQRTLYRWWRGEAEPHNKFLAQSFEDLVKSIELETIEQKGE